jgi:POT family proton-dependent oligopeptide transporter
MSFQRQLGFTRHPVGLSTLFFTELWERFSFYGMQAILVLYLVLAVEQGGMGYSLTHAAVIYGNYTMSVYLLSVLGGYLADRLIGATHAVLIGGITIAAGHFSIATGFPMSLYIGLGCIAIGTSLFKPNVTSLVGSLYAPDDSRRDSGFSLYYMGINIGAFMAPLVCGYLAQGAGFRSLLSFWGLDSRRSWHWGFAAAGVGMLIGLAVFTRSWSRFNQLAPKRSQPASAPAAAIGGGYAQRIGAILFFCASATLFFAMAKQAGSSLNLFADRLTRTEFFGSPFPSSWFQSVSAVFVVLLAPLFSILWLRMGERQPSSPVKAVLGLGAAALSFLIMTYAAKAAALGPVSPLWLLSVYFMQTIGELCISPVGLSNVTRLAPPRRVGLMLGIWFVAIAFGAKLAGLFAEWYGRAADELPRVFAQQALFVAAGCVLLAFLAQRVSRVIRKMGIA